MKRKLITVTKKQVKDYIIEKRPLFNSLLEFRDELKDVIEDLSEFAESNPNQIKFFSRVLTDVKNRIDAQKYRIQYNVGKVKYLVSYHDGIKTHEDGSEFYDIQTFTNKKKMNDFVKKLSKEGYSEA
jgi:hypothetical protein